MIVARTTDQRQAAELSRRAREDAARLQAAWSRYTAAGEALAGIRECGAIWPNTLADVAPVRCQLLEGHAARDGSQHRHRITGTQTILEWT